MNNVYIRKGKATGFEKTSSPYTPNGVEYESLMKDLENQSQQKQEITDLRGGIKESIDLIDNTKTTDKLIKDTVIPIPGMLINYENGQSDTPVHPTDGAFVPSGGLNWSGDF